MPNSKTTILDIQKKYDAGTPLTMITAYDYPSAVLVNDAGIDMILVGDSLGMVVLGYDNTVPVTMDEMVHHCQSVVRGAPNPFILGDMPFGSYEVTATDATRNAIRLMKEGHVDGVKLEGGAEVTPVVRAIVNAGIPVMGHIGLTPQSVSALGGFRVQGRTAEAAQHLLDDALALQDAGCFSIVLEAVPDRVGGYITEQLDIPTIGIGAGRATSGQVLVFHDVIGMFDRFVPKFSKQYIQAGQLIREALERYRDEVTSGDFPTADHSYTMPDDAFDALVAGTIADTAVDADGDEVSGLYGSS